MIAHLQLPRLAPMHFERWLQLWRKTADALCAEDVAQIFVERAEMIGARFLYERGDAPPFDAQLEFQQESNILNFAAHH